MTWEGGRRGDGGEGVSESRWYASAGEHEWGYITYQCSINIFMEACAWSVYLMIVNPSSCLDFRRPVPSSERGDRSTKGPTQGSPAGYHPIFMSRIIHRYLILPRDVNAGCITGLKGAGALGNHHRLAVDEDLYLVLRGRGRLRGKRPGISHGNPSQLTNSAAYHGYEGL